jgi:hypothetical protein
VDRFNQLEEQIGEVEIKLTAKIRFINDNLLRSVGFEKVRRQIDEALGDLSRIRVELDCLRHEYNKLCIQLNSTTKVA